MMSILVGPGAGTLYGLIVVGVGPPMELEGSPASF